MLAAAALMVLGAMPVLGMTQGAFPVGYEGYHDYAEMMADIDAVIAAHPGIVAKRSIGQSYEGRTIWAIKISDHVGRDENEPEVLMESLHHAREHLTVEQSLEIIHLLADNYRKVPTTALQQRVTNIVNTREIWIVPMVNPDGAEFDISSGTGFQNWRRNRQPIGPGLPIGIDLNRNWGYMWGCCHGSSGTPGATEYRGQYPWQAPEVVALRNFILSRRVGGIQQITEAISWHTFNEQVMWPYGYTKTDIPRTMTADDHAAFVALGTGIANRNGYTPQQMSDLYVLDGDASDWMYGDQRIFAFTIEEYPTDRSNVGGFYPPDSVITRETTRNDDAVLYFLEQAGCPYAVVPSMAVTHCGPLNDDFETSRGWTINPSHTDTATSGVFERAIPQRTSDAAGVKQASPAFSGQAELVTGASAGANANANDVDGGTTSAQSPAFKLGAVGSTGWTLDFEYTFAHSAQATAGDYLRVLVNDTEVFRVAGDGVNQNATWTHATLDLDAFAGQTARVTVEAADTGSDALVEAAVDDVRVYRAP
jgi:carboxypeptidase T